MMKRFLGLVLTVVMLFALGTIAFAAVSDTGFSDVAANDWFADSAIYVRDHGLMNGNTATTFNPNGTTTRGQIAAILYRASGSPAVTGGTTFPDVAGTAYYAPASRWASANGVVTGYTNGNFGPNDPITRQQLAAILWRYAGSPAASRGADFADESAISSYASTAVDWARDNGIITGRAGNLFDPNGRATRAQVAVILHRYMELLDADGPDATPGVSDGSRILVAYFTVPETSGVDAVANASRVVENGRVVGNVEFIARAIQEETGADIFAIETVQTYPGTHEALLDFAAAEMAANARPALSTRISNLADYDVIFLGYPIWNADLPMPLYTFLDTYDLSGKTVIPFTAHGGSGFAGTISTIASEEPRAEVERNGFSVSRSSVADSRSDIIDWVRELGYTQTQTPAQPEPIPTPGNDVDVLVAYFSQTGNTEEVAQRIADYTDGDLAEIQRATDYRDLQSEAQAEIESGAQPDITVDVDNIDEYEVIFIGYPIWWDEAPAMIATFLAENDFEGKILAPFCTSAYSPIDNSLHIFRELAPEADLADGFTANNLNLVQAWVDEVLEQAA